MNPKFLVGLLFLITFTVSFVIYLLVVNIITPHIDLSSTTKGSIEVAPEINDKVFVKKKKKDNVSILQEKAMHDYETYEPDISGMMNEPDFKEVSVKESSDDKKALPGVVDTLDTHSVRAPGEDYAKSALASHDNASDLSSIDVSDDLKAASSMESDANNEVTVNTVPSNEIDNTPVLDSNNQVDTPVEQEASEAVSPINRVVVGSYSSIDDAKKVYDEMINSDMDVAPIIKKMDGKYTLQVGAFTDKEKAQNMVKTLNKKNYSATIKSE